MDHNHTAAGRLVAFVTILIWGATFIPTKTLLRTFNPVEVLFIRFITGYLALWLARPRSLRLTPARQEELYTAAGFCGVTMHYLLKNITLTYTLTSNVGVIISTASFSTAILGWMFPGEERPRFRFFAGLLLAMTGINLINFGNGAVLSLNPIGDLLAVVAAAMWTVYSTLTKKISVLGRGTVRSTRRIFFYGVLFMVPALTFMGFYVAPAQFTDMKNILNPLLLGLSAPALCFVAWNIGVKILGPVKTSVHIYMASAITILASALILKGPVTVPATLGIIMTLVGLFSSEQKTMKEGEPKIRTIKMRNV